MTDTSLLDAAKLTLTMLDEMSTERFSKGEDKPAREALHAAIAQAEGAPFESDYSIFRAALTGPELLENLELALQWLDNLAEVIGDNALMDSCPNNWGGRVAIRAAIKKAKPE